jgi:DNA-binding NtrC family response regulator
MDMRVVIFEDDRELAEALQDYMQGSHFKVTTCYNLATPEWKECEVVIGDFRNAIVEFESLRKECVRLGLPLLAISGAETGYSPQLLKPFTTEDLKNAIFDTLANANRLGIKRAPVAKRSFFSRLFGAFE